MFKADGLLTDDKIRETILGQLSSVLNQDDDSNNARVLGVIADIVTQKQDDMLALSDLLKIKNAKGDILNLFAADWDVNRVDDDDDFLRFQINLKMLKNRLGDSMNDLKLLISIALGISPSEFDVKPTENIEEMKILNIPFNFTSTNRARKVELFESTLQEVMPVEWNLAEVQYATNSMAMVYVGLITQHLRTTHAGLMTSRENQITHHIYVGAATQQWRRTYAELKGVEA